MNRRQDVDFNLFDGLDFSLDDDLHLFDDEEWDFFDVGEDNLNEVSTFTAKVQAKREISLAVLLPYILIVTLVVGFGAWYFFFRDTSNTYENYMSTLENPTIKYKEGEEGTSEEYIEVGNFFQNYTTALQTSKTYDELDGYCINGSLMKEKYNEYVGKAKSTYDVYDSNAKALKMFGVNIQFGVIDKIIKTEGKYYIYINVSQPTKESIREYLNLHKFNAVKQFNGLQVSENELSRFILETMGENKILCSNVLMCIELEVKDGRYAFSTDADILDICTSGYNYAVTQLTGLIGATTNIKH